MHSKKGLAFRRSGPLRPPSLPDRELAPQNIIYLYYIASGGVSSKIPFAGAFRSPSMRISLFCKIPRKGNFLRLFAFPRSAPIPRRVPQIAQKGADFPHKREKAPDDIRQRHFLSAMFCPFYRPNLLLNFSTRPLVSTSFCLPV